VQTRQATARVSRTDTSDTFRPRRWYTLQSMADYLSPLAGLRGVIHSDDPNQVPTLRKLALTLDLMLEGYSRN
jgi:hypothetical protein